MRHQPEIRPVARFQEKGHARHEPKHGILVLRIRQADGNQEYAGEDGYAMDEKLLAPYARPRVDEVAEHASQRAEDDVEETEHGRPVAAPTLLEGREVLDVVCAEDAVDGEFGAEGAEVSASLDERLRGQDDGEGFAEGGLDNDFTASRVEHLLFADLGFVGEASDLLRLHGFESELLFVVGAAASAWAVRASGRFVCQFARDINNSTRDAMRCEILLHGEVPLAPLARGGIRATYQHGDGGADDAYERNDESNTPCHVRSKAAFSHKTVEDGGHKEVCDASAGIAEASGQGISGPNNVFVEKASGPDLTRDKTTS